VGGPRSVAVLLSDIVGSTSLLSAGEASYPTLLLRHRELLEEAAVRHGGRLSPREGDGCLGLFGSATAAIGAGVDGQRALANEPWPDEMTVRVRMVVHEGDVVDVAGEPVGLAVHHAARMLGRAGAAQLLVSEAAATSARPLPAGVHLVDAGTHRLRDLPRPVQLLQVWADGLVVSRTRGTTHEAEPLIGRDDEVADVCAALESHRMVTITGPGGSGKTRLAQAVADMWRGRGNDEEIRWVELASLSDPSLVPTALLDALGIDPRGDDALGALVGRLTDRRLLLVLDNCEQVVDGVRPSIEALTRGCPDVRVMATSRVRVGSGGEAERPLAPLAVPEVPDGRGDDLACIAASPSVGLFTGRAAAVRPGFRLAPSNATKVAQICRRLGGLPLAIELATARLGVLSLDQLLARLDDLDVLKGGLRRDPRQRTMRATIDWSHELLNPDEQAAFRRLSVFVGGFALDAAEVVLQPFGLDADTTMDLVERLLANGLILANLESDEPRFHMLEPVRQYAAERLVANGESERAHMALVAWVVAMAEAAGRAFFVDQVKWAPRLREEQPNIRAALLNAVTCGDGVSALRITAALGYPWFTMGQPGARVLIDRAMEVPGPVDERLRAQALLSAGMMAQNATDLEVALPLLEEALSLFEACGSRRGQGWALVWLSRDQDRFTETARQTMLERAVALFRETRYLPGIAWSLAFLAGVRVRAGDIDAARPLAEEAFAVASSAGAPQPLAEALRMLGLIEFHERDLAEARRLWEHAAHNHRAADLGWQYASAPGQLGSVAALMGDRGPALEHFTRAVDLSADVASRDQFAVLLEVLVPFLWDLARYDDASQLLGAYDAIRPDYHHDPLRHVAAQVRATSRLERARIGGTALPLAEAIKTARRTLTDTAAVKQ
jgi:predicted ATPase